MTLTMPFGKVAPVAHGQHNLLALHGGGEPQHEHDGGMGHTLGTVKAGVHEAQGAVHAPILYTKEE